MAQSPGYDVATRLATALTFTSPPGGSLTLTLGTNLFIGPERAVEGSTIPAQAVFCLGSGGPQPRPYLGASVVGGQRLSRVQVVVRSTSDDFDGGEALARACLTRLERAELSGYYNCRVLESEPNYIGQNEHGLHRWTLNVELWWETT